MKNQERNHTAKAREQTAQREIQAPTPSTKELAKIAAMLAHGRDFDSEGASQLVKRAQLLFDAAQRRVSLDSKHRTEAEEARRQREAETPQIPVTPKPDLPGAISLGRFLRSFKFKTEGDGLATYRAHLAVCGGADVSAVVARDRAQGISTENFPAAAMQFARWLRDKRALTNRERASAGGRGKKAKAEAEKPAKRKTAKKTP